MPRKRGKGFFGELNKQLKQHKVISSALKANGNTWIAKPISWLGYGHQPHTKQALRAVKLIKY